MFKLIVSLTLFFVWVESSPARNSFDFDKLDTDLSNLSYEVEEEDIDDFSKLLDDGTTDTTSASDKTNVKTSGFKKKNAVNKGVKNNHDIEDLKKFYKEVGAHDAGTTDDGDVYAFVKALATKGVGITGNEERKYKKGTKTRGYHRVLHKDEYKKDKEIYEDDETSGVIKKVGAKGLGFEIGGGADFDKGYFHHDRNKGIAGKQGYSDKGSGSKKYNGYLDSQGFDAYFSSEN